MGRAFLFGVMCAICGVSLAGCDGEARDRAMPVVDFVPNGDLKLEREIEGYTIRIYGPDMDWNGSFEILQGERRVYGEHGKTFGLEFDEGLPGLPELGLDITADGEPNVVVGHWSGGAHCCYSAYIFQLGDDFKLLAHVEGHDGGIGFKNLDDQRDLELRVSDPTFGNWKTAWAFSPRPGVVLKWNGQAYAVAGEIMRTERPTEQEMAEIAAPLRDPAFWQQPLEYRSELWARMLDLIYTGHPDLGWSLLNTWPDEVPGRDEFAVDFYAELMKSPFYRQLPWADTP